MPSRAAGRLRARESCTRPGPTGSSVRPSRTATGARASRPRSPSPRRATATAPRSSTSAAPSPSPSSTRAPIRSPAVSRTWASMPATRLVCCAGTTATSSRPAARSRRSGRTRCTSIPVSPRTSCRSVHEREGAVALVYDEEFTRLATVAGIARPLRRVGRFAGHHDADARSSRRALRVRRTTRSSRAAEQLRHPHVGHDGSAEGRASRPHFERSIGAHVARLHPLSGT